MQVDPTDLIRAINEIRHPSFYPGYGDSSILATATAGAPDSLISDAGARGGSGRRFTVSVPSRLRNER